MPFVHVHFLFPSKLKSVPAREDFFQSKGLVQSPKDLGCSSGAVSLPSEHDNSSLGDSSSPGVALSGSKVAIDGPVKFDATL